MHCVNFLRMKLVLYLEKSLKMNSSQLIELPILPALPKSYKSAEYSLQCLRSNLLLRQPRTMNIAGKHAIALLKWLVTWIPRMRQRQGLFR